LLGAKESFRVAPKLLRVAKQSLPGAKKSLRVAKEPLPVAEKSFRVAQKSSRVGLLFTVHHLETHQPPIWEK
jgi:hypothetical protein